MSTTSNLSRFASRPSVANLSMAQKQIAPTTTIIKTPIKTEIMATSLCCRTSFRLRLRLINASLTKLCRPFGEPASALCSFFGRRGGIDNLFDSLCGELLSAQPPAGLADGSRWCLDLEAELDQAADGFGAILLTLFAPSINLFGQACRKTNGTDRIDTSSLFRAPSRFPAYGN